jgi:hypothetical protein
MRIAPSSGTSQCLLDVEEEIMLDSDPIALPNNSTGPSKGTELKSAAPYTQETGELQYQNVKLVSTNPTAPDGKYKGQAAKHAAARRSSVEVIVASVSSNPPPTHLHLPLSHTRLF